MITFWFGAVRDLLFRWTSSGTASGSVWNGSISSRVNARPIRTVLVRFHKEPFPCKRGQNPKDLLYLPSFLMLVTRPVVYG